MRDMIKIIFLSFSIELILVSACHAQFPFTFTETAHTQYTTAFKTAIGKNNTVFLIEINALRTYNFSGSGFDSIAYFKFTNDGSRPPFIYDIAAGMDNMVFTANTGDGLWSYSFDGKSFHNTAHIYDRGKGHSLGDLLDVGSARSVALGTDGTVFLANGGDGLRAYEYKECSFINTAHIDSDIDSLSWHSMKVKTDSSGNIYLGNNDGLRVFSYDGTSFHETARLKIDLPVNDIALAKDSIIFLSFGLGGLGAYRFNGSSFIELDHISTKYESESDFYGEAKDIDLSKDGTVFLANGKDGLRAYEFKNSSFINTAHVKPDYSFLSKGAVNVAVNSDGTIFLASSDSGLIAYKYSPVTGLSQDPSITPIKFNLSQNYPNPFNPSTEIDYQIPEAGKVTIKVYDIVGREIATLVNSYKEAGRYSVEFNASSLPSGTYIYELRSDDNITSRKMMLVQ